MTRARVRHARPADATVLRSLQDHLREPSPELLEYGLAVGDALVSVAGTPPAPDTPVGYLLPVSSDEGTHLAELVVAPEHRREGRARELLEAAIAAADGPVTLQVAPDNEPARELYASLGFEQVGRREDAYEDGDALVYRRST